MNKRKNSAYLLLLLVFPIIYYIIFAKLFFAVKKVAEVITMLSGVGFGFHPPLLPLQILWVNLITGTAPALALSIQPGTHTY